MPLRCLPFCPFTEPDNVRLVGGTSHCAGTLEIKQQGEWRPAKFRSEWNLHTSAAVCRQLDCGSVLSTGRISASDEPVWEITSRCEASDYLLRECLSEKGLGDVYGRRRYHPRTSDERLEVICSGNT